IIVQNVTKPKLALLHQKLPKGTSQAGKRFREGVRILAELVSAWQECRATPRRQTVAIRAPPPRLRSRPPDSSIAGSSSEQPTPRGSPSRQCPARNARWPGAIPPD